MAVAPATPQVAFVIQAMEDHISDVVRKVVLDVNFELLRTTPVDTGWARANWAIDIGREPKASSPPVNSGAGLGRARAKQAAGQAKMASYSVTQGKVFITNNVPYIGRLNKGWSKQAPAGFIEAAVMRAVIKNGGRPA